MAKGDHEAVNNAITAQQQQQQQQQNALRSNMNNVTTGFQTQLANNQGLDTDLRNQIQAIYGQPLGSASGGIGRGDITSMGTKPYSAYETLSQGLSPEFRNKFEEQMGGMNEAENSYRNFINTGGFSAEDLANMRARASAPITAAYGNQMNQLNRQNVLSGGNMANLAAARSRMTRDATMNAANANIANESNLAQMVQQGKLQGTSGLANTAAAAASARTAVESLNAEMIRSGAAGMSDIEKARLSAELQNAQINQNASMFNAELPLKQAEGMTRLLGTTPAASAMSGNQLLQSEAEQNQLQGLSQSGNQGLINSMISASQVPSNWQSAMGNIGSLMGLGGQGASLLSGLGKGTPGGGNNPGNIGTQNPVNYPIPTRGNYPGPNDPNYPDPNYPAPPPVPGNYPGPNDPNYPDPNYPNYPAPTPPDPWGDPNADDQSNPSGRW